MAGSRQRPPKPTLREAMRCPLLEGDLDQWIRCCTGRFLPVARRVAGDDDDARDALQDSLIIVLEKLHQYRGASPACGWVGAIVRHEAQHGATAHSRQLPPEFTDYDGPRVRPRVPTTAPWDSPEAAAYSRELLRVALAVIDELPPTFREVVRLRNIERRPPDEVARLLHISSQNVAVRLHRAHKLLRPRLLRRLAGSAASIRSSQKNL